MLEDFILSTDEVVNPHYLRKYLTFVSRFSDDNRKPIERHHILPKKIFPQYASFSSNPWNKASLSPREHYIAHLLLHKALPHNEDIFYAIWCMKHQNGISITSKQYDNLKRKYSKIASRRAKGKIVVKNQVGETFKVEVDDPRRLSGELVPFSTGMSLSKLNVENYKKHKSKSHAKNIARYRSIRHVITGEVIRVLQDDPRTSNGEYVHITSGLKRSPESRHKTSASNSKPQSSSCCLLCHKEVSVNNLARHQSGKRCRA